MDYVSKANNIIDNLKLPNGLDDNKEILKARFVEEVSYYEKKRNHTQKFYNTFRFIVTTGSILLPAILSMGQMDPSKLPKNFDQITYWSSWSISLMVTISNGFLQLFSLDKNYFNYSLVVEQLKTEGWQYFGLSGKYEEYDTHSKEAYKEFCKAVENIKRKQVEQEFQGKGNNTKKKKTDEPFNFDGQMKSFIERSSTNETYKPLINATNNITNVPKLSVEHLNDPDTLLDNITDNLKEVLDTTTENITVNLKEVLDTTNNTTEKLNNDATNLTTTIFDDIENVNNQTNP